MTAFQILPETWVWINEKLAKNSLPKIENASYTDAAKASGLYMQYFYQTYTHIDTTTDQTIENIATSNQLVDIAETMGIDYDQLIERVCVTSYIAGEGNVNDWIQEMYDAVNEQNHTYDFTEPRIKDFFSKHWWSWLLKQTSAKKYSSQYFIKLSETIHCLQAEKTAHENQNINLPESTQPTPPLTTSH